MVRAGLYMRVSGAEQEQWQTIKAQEHYLRQHCARNGVTVAEVYRDEDCESEIPLERRPDGHRLLADCEAGRLDTVLVFRSCRISRYPAVYHAARKALLRCRVDLESISERLSWDTPGDAFSSDILLRSNQ